MPAVIIIVAIAALVLIGWVAAVQSRKRSASGAGKAAAAGSAVDTRPRPQVSEFHVAGDRATVVFAVPIPEGGADPVLTDLLASEAVEVVREKRHELPIDQVHVIQVCGTQNGVRTVVQEVTLATPGTLPPPSIPDLVPHASKVGFDPIGNFDTGSVQAVPTLADVGTVDTLGPIASDVRLIASAEAGLRAQGIDTETMTAGQMVLGLLRMLGYQLTAGERPTTHFALKDGQRTYIRIVDHQSGDHPELAERTINEFMVNFVSSGADRGILVSDKYAPFAIYEKERRESRVKYISRERLQHFVDSLMLR